MDDCQSVYVVRTELDRFILCFLRPDYPIKTTLCVTQPPQHSCTVSTRIQCQDQIVFSDEDSNTFLKVAENRQFPFQSKLLKKDGRQASITLPLAHLSER